jgi:hypothetical protein
MSSKGQNSSRPMYSHPLLSANQPAAQVQTDDHGHMSNAAMGSATQTPMTHGQPAGYSSSGLSPEAPQFKPSRRQASNTQISSVGLNQPAQGLSSNTGQTTSFSSPQLSKSQNELENGQHNQLGPLKKKQRTWADPPDPSSHVGKGQQSEPQSTFGFCHGRWQPVHASQNGPWPLMGKTSNILTTYIPGPLAYQPALPAPMPPALAYPPTKCQESCDARKWLMYELSRQYFVREHARTTPNGLAALHSRWAAGYVNAPNTTLDLRIKLELVEWLMREFPWSQESDPNGVHQIRKYAQHLQDRRVHWEERRDAAAQKEREGEAARVVSELKRDQVPAKT